MVNIFSFDRNKYPFIAATINNFYKRSEYDRDGKGKQDLMSFTFLIT